jgi:hypothetical protein
MNILYFLLFRPNGILPSDVSRVAGFLLPAYRDSNDIPTVGIRTIEQLTACMQQRLEHP